MTVLLININDPYKCFPVSFICYSTVHCYKKKNPTPWFKLWKMKYNFKKANKLLQREFQAFYK